MSRQTAALARLSERPVLRFTLGVDADETEPIILDCSGAVSTALGYDPDDLLGRQLGLLYDDEQSVSEGGQVRLQTADGEAVPAVGAADHTGGQLRVVFILEPRRQAGDGAARGAESSTPLHSFPWYRDQLYTAFTDPAIDPGTAIERALELCAEYLNMELGFTTKIVDGTQSITRTSGSYEHLQPGMSCPLDEAYCRRTVERDGLLCAQEAAASDEIDDVAVKRFQLGSYIGRQLRVDGKLHGTVCFADPEPRDRQFSTDEQLFVEAVGTHIARTIERGRDTQSSRG